MLVVHIYKFHHNKSDYYYYLFFFFYDDGFILTKNPKIANSNFDEYLRISDFW